MKVDESFIKAKYFIKKDENIIATFVQIHEKIRQARVSARLTEDEMAKKLGVKRSTYQYWEKKTPGITKIKQVAKVLGLPEAHFFGKNDEDLNNGTPAGSINPEPSPTDLPPAETMAALIVRLMNQQIQLMERQNALIQEQKEHVTDKIKEIDLNLKAVRGQAEGIQFDLVSGREVILQSLARIEKNKDENYLLNAADSKRQSLLQAKNEHYSSSNKDK